MLKSSSAELDETNKALREARNHIRFSRRNCPRFVERSTIESAADTSVEPTDKPMVKVRCQTCCYAVLKSAIRHAPKLDAPKLDAEPAAFSSRFEKPMDIGIFS